MYNAGDFCTENGMTHFDPYYRWLGIPPDEQPPNHYRLLGVRLFEPDPDVIAVAADARMMLLRSLQTGKHGTLSQKLLTEVAAARICLLHAGKKAAYDGRLRAESVVPPPVAGRDSGGDLLPRDASAPPAPPLPPPPVRPPPLPPPLSRPPRRRG